MSPDRQEGSDARIGSIVAELQAKIVQRYPTASFEVFQGEDPVGTYLRAIVDVDDPDSATDLIVDRLLPLQVDERLPLYFIAAKPVEKALQEALGGRPARPHVTGAAIHTSHHQH
jgi:hypothetical protein